jgi:predicted ATPase
MLETIREFGLEHLRSSRNAAEVRGRHAAHLLHWAERLDLVSRTDDHGDAYRELDLEIANFRAATGWAREDGRSELLLESRRPSGGSGRFAATSPRVSSRWRKR